MPIEINRMNKYYALKVEEEIVFVFLGINNKTQPSLTFNLLLLRYGVS